MRFSFFNVFGKKQPSSYDTYLFQLKYLEGIRKIIVGNKGFNEEETQVVEEALKESFDLGEKLLGGGTLSLPIQLLHGIYVKNKSIDLVRYEQSKEWISAKSFEVFELIEDLLERHKKDKTLSKGALQTIKQLKAEQKDFKNEIKQNELLRNQMESVSSMSSGSERDSTQREDSYAETSSTESEGSAAEKSDNAEVRDEGIKVKIT